MAKFTHLHVHSDYSLLDGLGKVKQLVARTAELGMDAMALTDHGVLHGAIEFYQEANKAGIKPIIGEEAYVAPRLHTDKTAGVDNRPYHLILLAQNFEGYQNLIKLTSAAHLDGYYYKPRIDRDLLSRHSAGLIATSACLASETSRLIMDKNWDQLDDTLNVYREIFGPDHYYLELQHHPSIPEQQVVNQHLIRLAKEKKLPLIVTNDVHYVNSDDNVPHDVLVCIQTGKLVSDKNRMLYTGDFSLKHPDELAQAFPDHPEALTNTLKITDMVNLDIPLGQNLLPHFPLPAGETEQSMLKKLCHAGLQKRYSDITPEIQARLDYELETVAKTGFPGYMLIVADMVNFARRQGIIVGPGRGSAAGSLIAYVLGITSVDPIRYGLLFERFLDTSRITMPDIDMDFEDVRRGEVINYLKDKYGADHVAGIITFGTIMARAAVRDVARVLGVAYTDADRIAKAVPAPIQGRHVPLSKSVQDSPELKAIYDAEPEAKQVIDMAIRVEGTIRHASQHACAIVISKEPLDAYVPVQESQGGDIHQVTQYSMGPIEAIGLLKMDLLGLSNLTIMRQATEIIEAVYGQTIDLDNLPLDDKKTFQLFGQGDTTGVFQLESAGMKRYIKELKPTRFEDIIAMVALYRPGPMQWIESFINRKNGKEPVAYLHPLAETAFRETFGIPLYQEQVMQMSKDMCGFTGGEADTLRKAIGKKIPKLMKEMKAKFIDGAVSKGVVKSQAEDIFRQLEDFAAYCFNKSHATCYALIAYQTAYLKAHFPDCFMAALMTSDLHDIDRISIEISESERLGLTVMPPEVNESFADFAVVKDKQAIRFGLSAIKNVGTSVAEKIVRERKANGPYQSLESFLTRLSGSLNKKVLDSLVRSGALDAFQPRANLYAGLELLVKYASGNGKADQNQLSIFATEGTTTPALSPISLPSATDDPATNLAWEKELLGLYLSDHPLKQYAETLNGLVTPIGELTIAQAGQRVRLAGTFQTVKKITTKSNQPMAFAQFEDLTGALEAVFFPNSYEAVKDLLVTGQVVVLEGRLNDKDGSLKLLTDTVRLADGLDPASLVAINQTPAKRSSSWSKTEPAAQVSRTTNYLIDLPEQVTKETINQLRGLLEQFPGPTPVELRITQQQTVRSLKTSLKVAMSENLAGAVTNLLHPSRAGQSA